MSPPPRRVLLLLPSNWLLRLRNVSRPEIGHSRLRRDPPNGGRRGVPKGDAREGYSSRSDTARDTASLRVATSSFEKMCLTCDLTVSGEISRLRAIRLLEWPWPIMERTPRSRAVIASLSIPGCLEPLTALGTDADSNVSVRP